MKKLLMLLTMIFSLTAFAQIEIKKASIDVTVGKAQQMGVLTAELSYRISDEDTIYTIVYRNCRYTSIVDFKSFSFDGVGNTKNELHKILKSFFVEENRKNKEYKLDLKLGDTNVSVSGEKMGFGTYCVRIWTERGYFYLTENQVGKLFGLSNT